MRARTYAGGMTARLFHMIERVPLRIAWPWALLATLALCGVALAVRLLATPLLPPGYPFVTFLPAVIVSAFIFGTRMGVVAGVVCGVIAWLGFVVPTHGASFGGAFAMLFYAAIVATDIGLTHLMQFANRRLARERSLSGALAETRELLFHELQHRVSNNLQMVAGLLSVQKRTVSDPGARTSLDEASRRIALIGRISRSLYGTDGKGRRVHEFLPTLCNDIVDASGQLGIRCTIDIADDLEVTADAAIPLALIVAEAMANAIEHGFAGRADGSIGVELRTADGLVHVEVRDDGHGLPEGFDIDASGSLGLKIARTLAEGMKGRFELVTAAGTIARLTLPAATMRAV